MSKPGGENLQRMEVVQGEIETLQRELDDLVITLLVEIERRLRRADEDLQALYHVFDWERIVSISEELEHANLTADIIGPKLEHAHALRELARILKLLIRGSDAEFQKELHRFKIATLHLKNLVLLGVLLDLLEQLKEVGRLERKMAI